MANRIYVEQSVKIRKKYVKHVGPANVRSVDFRRSSEDVRVRINAWVNKRTAGMIPDILPPGGLSTDTNFVVSSAFFFKGNWTTSFPVDRTRDETFHAVGGDQRVPFMWLSELKVRVKDVRALDALLFAMPYEREEFTNEFTDEFTMYVLLPKKRDGWKTAEEGLLSQIGSLFAGGFRDFKVNDLKMPKWEMEQTLEPLKDMLVKLGLSTAFSSAADFSGISRIAPVKISEFIHKAKIIVDEEVEILYGLGDD